MLIHCTSLLQKFKHVSMPIYAHPLSTLLQLAIFDLKHEILVFQESFTCNFLCIIRTYRDA